MNLSEKDQHHFFFQKPNVKSVRIDPIGTFWPETTRELQHIAMIFGCFNLVKTKRVVKDINQCLSCTNNGLHIIAGVISLTKTHTLLHCRFILLTAFIIIGLIGNTLSIIILRRPAFSHSSTIPFLLFLAVFDNIEIVTGELQECLTYGYLRSLSDSLALELELPLERRIF